MAEPNITLAQMRSVFYSAVVCDALDAVGCPIVEGPVLRTGATQKIRSVCLFRKNIGTEAEVGGASLSLPSPISIESHCGRSTDSVTIALRSCRPRSAARSAAHRHRRCTWHRCARRR